MKVFISWSGSQGEQVAHALRGWLPYILPNLDLWMSASDIVPGTRWSLEVAKQLDSCDFGVICLTRDSLNSPWILFESGALAKSLEKSRICPYLIGLTPSEVTGPLVQFQAVRATKRGTFQLIVSLHGAQTDFRLTDTHLHKTFETFWPDLQASLNAVKSTPESHLTTRSERSLLEELLEISRAALRGRSLRSIPRSTVTAQDKSVLVREIGLDAMAFIRVSSTSSG